MTNTRLAPKERRAQILQSALKAAAKNPQFTFKDVATEASVTPQLVVHYFSTMTQLRREVMRAAVKQEVVSIVARGLVAGDAHARKASAELRARASTYLTERTTG